MQRMGVDMKKNLLTVLILALLLVNIILTAVLMFSISGTNKQTAKLVANIATVLNLEMNEPGESEVKEEISLKDTATFAITGSMTIPLAGDSADNKTRYIMFDVALSMNKKHADYKNYGATILDWETQIKDVITSVVSRHTENECRNNLEGLKEEILDAIQELFGSDFIYKVGISEVMFG